MKTALLIIDMQKDYFENGANPLSGSVEASLKAKEILEHFRTQNFPVFHIQHTNIRPGSKFLLPDTPGIEIHENVKPVEGEKIILKHFPNSFRETGLLEYLQKTEITDLVICGMMTHMCVDATTRAAKDFGYNIMVISDACATKDLELSGVKTHAKDAQNAFLAALNYYYAKAVTAEEYLGGK